MDTKISRKDFIKKTTLTGAGLAAMPFSITKGYDDSKVRLGIIGAGGRGTSHVKGLLKRPDVEIPAICDIRKAHANRAKNLVTKAGQQAPELYTRGETDFKRMVARNDLDGVLIATPWRWHTPMAVAAMEAGKYAATEVPAAITVDECWDLVNTSEATGMPCMILENVCYRPDVMAILNMVRQGLFGEMIHARCGYQHDLREAMLGKNRKFGPEMTIDKSREWRVFNHIKRNGDLYPTHGIGPVAHWLDINRGNRFVKLTSSATKARGLHNYIIKHGGKDHPDADIEFVHGDVVTSTITTAKDETIIATHTTSLARPYSLGFRCQGTKGLWNPLNNKANTPDDGPGGRWKVLNNSIYLEDKSPHHDQWESFDSYQQKYEAPLLKKHQKQATGASHGGMDWFVRNAFVEAIKRDAPPPIDVYDAAAWSVIGPLSEESIAKGGAPVEFPDFTDGHWMQNERIFDVNGEY